MIDVHVDGIIFAEQPRGGISRMWANILRRLPDQGCRVHLYLPQAATQRLELPDTIDIVKYPRKQELRPGRLFRRFCDARFRAAVNRMWARPVSGVYHSTHFTTYPSLRIPQIVTVHDLFHERLPDCFEERERGQFTARRKLCVEQATRLVADSDATVKDMTLVYKCAASAVRTIPLAVEPAFRKINDEGALQRIRNLLAQGHPYILFVGTRYTYKNFSALLAAYALWPHRANYRLVAVGPSVSCQESAQVRAYKLDDLVHFRSSLSDEDLVAAYNAAAATVVPSLSEGYGFPVCEAMACGTPVVAARAGSLPEVGKSTAVYFDHGSPALLTAAIDEAVRIDRDGERIREGIRTAIARTWDDVAREYAAVYQEVQARDGRSAPGVFGSPGIGPLVNTDAVA